MAANLRLHSHKMMENHAHRKQYKGVAYIPGTLSLGYKRLSIIIRVNLKPDDYGSQQDHSANLVLRFTTSKNAELFNLGEMPPVVVGKPGSII